MEGQPQRTGRRIKLLTPLGKGGFGAVYLADVTTRDGLVQRLAVKLLHESWANDSGIAARARDEARLMSQLNHDNVLKIYGLTRLSDRAAVLMEYVEGVDCRTMVVETARAAGDVRGLPPRVAAGIIERAAGALAAAWADVSPQTGQPLRVVHRDIKPSNLLVSINGAVKVMDFGVARADFEREALTGSVQFGTHRYMAPERWLKGEAGHASDLFSLGVTFWELLTGVRFERLPLDPAVYVETRDKQIARLHRLGLPREVADALAALIRDMTAYDEDARADALAVEERLGALEGQLSGEGLRRFARRVLPPLVQSQLHTLKSDPDLLDMTGTLLVEDTPASQDVVEQDVVEQLVAAEASAPLEWASAAPATAPVPALTADLPTPRANDAGGRATTGGLTGTPTNTPSSEPTHPIERLSPPAPATSEVFGLMIPDPLSASVIVPQQRGGAGWAVAALGIAVALGAGVLAWSGWLSGGVPAAAPTQPIVAEVIDGAPDEVAGDNAEPAEPPATASAVAADEAPADEAPVDAAPADAAPAEPAAIADASVGLSAGPSEGAAAPPPEAAVNTSSLAPTRVEPADAEEAPEDGIVEVAIGEAEEAAPDVRVIRLVEAEPPPAVTFKLIASPREGSFTLNGVTYGVGAVSLPEGSYQLEYVGPDWRRSCAVHVHAGLSRIKVVKEVPGCQAS